MNIPRNKEDFDEWFAKGDPWGYDSSYVRDRLFNSINFIKQKIPANFNGNIIEFGSYNGDFTQLLSVSYPQATIFANDISSTAMDNIIKKTKGLNNIEYALCNMLDFPFASLPKKDTLFLFLECLYYMPFDDQNKLIATIQNRFPRSLVFFSAPITGGKYYEENRVISMFCKYNLKDCKVLNFRQKISFYKLMIFIATKIKFVRKLYANQVIFFFKPNEKL